MLETIKATYPALTQRISHYVSIATGRRAY